MQHPLSLARKTVFSIIILAAYTGCKGDQRLVNARGGLYMRQSPQPNARAIELLPNGTRVKFIEEAGPKITIDGISSKWTKIKNINTGNQGWVFGGYLITPKSRSFDNDSIVKVKSGSGKSELVFNAASYYERHWVNVANTAPVGEPPSNDEREEAHQILKDPEAKVTVKKISGDIAVIGVPVGHGRFTELYSEYILWQLHENKWRRHPAGIVGSNTGDGSLELVDLNGDGQEDILAVDQRGEAPGNFLVYLREKNGRFKLVQTSPQGYFQVKSQGKCNDSIITGRTEMSGAPVNYVFDCHQNKFVREKK